MLKKFRTFFCLAMALCLSVGMTLTAHADDLTHLTLNLSSEPPSLDPALAHDTTSAAVLNNVFETLYVQVDGEIKPGVAESYEISDDQLTYTFKLRDNAKWTNGEAVTAHDFEYAWLRFLDPETAAHNTYQFTMIEGAEAFNEGKGKVEDVGIKAEDDHTLVVKLTHPTPYFIQLVCSYNLSPVYREVVEDDKAWASDAGDQYVTNGAYRLTSWDHNSQIVVERNKEYWDNDNTVIEKATMLMIESESTASAEYQAGNLSYLGPPYGKIDLDSLDKFRRDDSLNTKPFAAIYYYTINHGDELMANENMRKALALSFNRQELIDNVTKGNETAALGIVPNSISGFEDKPEYFKDGDVETAKEHLAKAMEELDIKDAGDITINLSMNESEAHSVIAQYIQEAWAQNLGVKVELDSSEWQVYLEKLSSHDYQVGRIGWTGKYDDGTTVLDLYRTLEGNNDTQWLDDEYVELLKQSDLETDPAKRLEILHQAEARFMDIMPVIPIYYYSSNYVVRDKYENLEPDAFGKILLKDVRIVD